MEQAHVDRYLRGLDAFSRGDFEAWLAEAPDEWHTTATFPGVEPVYRGREGLTALWEFMRAPWDMHAEIERLENLGDKLLVLLTARVKGKSSGAEAEWKAAHVVWVRDDTTYLKNYLSWEDGLAAVGLPPDLPS